jgi:hypothetical protein
MALLTKTNEHDYQKVSLPILPTVPCLTTTDEQKYLYWLTNNAYQAKGAVVEIGTWFGCSAGYLAAGLRDANKNNSLFCFDRFSLSSSEKARLREQGFDYEYLPVNSDTSHLVQKHLDPVYAHCILQKKVIDEISWNNGSVEIIHFDAPKRASDVLHVLKVFGPHLIPHESVIVVQDFCVPRAYALPLIFGALAHSFELVQVPSATSTTVTFQYLAPYTIDERLNINRWQSSRALQMVQKFLPYLNVQQQQLLFLGLAFFCYDHGDKEMAEEITQAL